MHKHRLMSMVIVSSALVAQGETKFEVPQSTASPVKSAEVTPPAAKPSLALRALPEIGGAKTDGRGFATRGELAVDRAGTVLRVSADGYKVAFADGGAEFVPFFGSTATRNWPIKLALRGVHVGGAALELSDSPPTLHGESVDLDHRAVVETYHLGADSIEQTFRFDTLSDRGELCLEIAVDTELRATPRDGGFEFEGRDGCVRYGKAFAVDALGDRIELAVSMSDGDIRLAVPESFVSRAQLPLVIDPVIGVIGLVETRTKQVRDTDLVWNEPEGRFVMCFESVFSATDSDVFARTLDATMIPTGSTIVIDNTSVSWRACRIACLPRVHSCLVVAEVSSGNVSPFRIDGRIIDTTSAPLTLPQFTIAGSGIPSPGSGLCIHPDVGGDPASPAVYFTVVWEREFSPIDHDIEMRQVTLDGHFHGSIVGIDSSSGFENHPVISKSDGAAPTVAQDWAIVYRRDSIALGTGHLRAALVRWDGVVRTILGGSQFAITGTTPTYAGGFDVTAPTDASTGGRFLAAETRADGLGGSLRIHATVFDRTGAIVVPTTMIQANERNLAFDCSAPAVDTDGCRFAMAWQNQFDTGIPQNNDVLVRTYGIIGNALVAQDGAAPGSTNRSEYAPALCALRNGSGPGLKYGMAWAHDLGGSQWSIEVARYEGRGYGGVTMRPTGCGTVSLGTSGTPALGEDFGLHVSGSAVLFGLLAGTQASIAFPDCTCLLGVSGEAFMGSVFEFTVPCDAALVGGVVAFQGFGIGGGGCLAALGLSNTADVTIE